MTSIPVSDPDASVLEAPVSWRHLQRHLWSGTRAGLPLGTIEQGRRFTSISERGAVLGQFRTLGEAQDSLTGPVEIVVGGADRRSPRRPVALVVASTVAGAIALVLAASGLFLIR